MDFNNFSTNPASPSVDQIEITPNDSTDLVLPIRAIYVGGGGTLRITNAAGNIRNFTGLVAGMIYPFAARRVHATGTTATGIVGLR